MKLQEIVRRLVWLLPSTRAKNAMLRRLGHDIHPSASIGPNLVLHVRRFEVGEGGVVGRFNLFKHLETVTVGAGGRIGRMNIISAHPAYGRLYPDGARLQLARGAKVTSRHTVDCSGGVVLGEFASIAGRQTLVLTHSIDVGRDCQVAYPVEVGERSFVGARSVLLGGATLPPRSLLGAGSVLTRSRGEQRSGVWAGTPATYRGPKEGLWFDRESTSTRRVYVPATDSIVEDAF